VEGVQIQAGVDIPGIPDQGVVGEHATGKYALVLGQKIQASVDVPRELPHLDAEALDMAFEVPPDARDPQDDRPRQFRVQIMDSEVWVVVPERCLPGTRIHVSDIFQARVPSQEYVPGVAKKFVSPRAKTEVTINLSADWADGRTQYVAGDVRFVEGNPRIGTVVCRPEEALLCQPEEVFSLGTHEVAVGSREWKRIDHRGCWGKCKGKRGSKQFAVMVKGFPVWVVTPEDEDWDRSQPFHIRQIVLFWEASEDNGDTIKVQGQGEHSEVTLNVRRPKPGEDWCGLGCLHVATVVEKADNLGDRFAPVMCCC